MSVSFCNENPNKLTQKWLILNKVYGLLKFKTMPCIKKGLSEVATNRPSIIEITSALRAAF